MSERGIAGDPSDQMLETLGQRRRQDRPGFAGQGAELVYLHQLTLQLHADLDVSAVMQTLSRAVIEVLAADLCLVGLIDGRRAAALSSGLNSLPAADSQVLARLAERTSLEQTTADLFECRLETDHAPSGQPNVRAVARRYGFSRLRTLPLFGEDGGPIGFLAGYCRRSEAVPAARRQLLTLCAGQASLALRNAQIWECQREETQISNALLAVAEATSRLTDLDEFLAEVARVTQRVAGVDRCAIFLWDKALQSFVGRQAHGLAEDELQRFIGVVTSAADFPALQRLRSTRRPLAVDDAAHSTLVPPWFTERLSSKSLLAVPITYHEEITGLVAVDYVREPHHFSPRQVAIVSGIASQAAIGIEDARLRVRDISVLQQLNQFSASRLRLSELGDQILAKFEELFGYKAGGLLVFERETNTFRPMAARGYETNWLEVCTWLEENGSAESPSRPNRPIRVLRREDCPCLRLWERDDHDTLVIATLEVEDRLIGLLVLVLASDAKLSLERGTLLASLAGQAALVLRNAELYRGSRELAVTEERRRIARDIHDGVAQNMAHLMLKADLIQKLVGRDPSRAVEEASTLRAGIQESVQELRRCIHSLRPVHLAEFGLNLALRRVAEDIAEQGEMELDLQLPNDLRLGSGTEAAVFRIIQEALNNVRKHAKASRVQIDLREEKGFVTAAVTDDGSGFAPDRAVGEVEGHFGLAQMRERAREVGGDLQIRSIPGQGTCVEVVIPSGRSAVRQPVS